MSFKLETLVIDESEATSQSDKLLWHNTHLYTLETVLGNIRKNVPLSMSFNLHVYTHGHVVLHMCMFIISILILVIKTGQQNMGGGQSNTLVSTVLLWASRAMPLLNALETMLFLN